MKYPYRKEVKQRYYAVPSLKGGISSAEKNIECLEECINMWYKNGALTTRPGFNCKDKNYVFFGEYYDKIHSGPRNEGVKIVLNGCEYDVASAVISDEYSFYKICTFFIDSDGNVVNSGNINYNRINDETFYAPTRYFFVSAKPTYSSGLYLFVTSENIGYEAGVDYQIYEYSYDEMQWQRLYNRDFYVPTVYINGRGTSYLQAQLNGMEYDAEPMVLQPQNLLTGEFKCYFTSDGYSSAFKLPLGELDNEVIKCRIYTKADAFFEWVIHTDETEATTAFAGYDVTLKCDRAAGVLEFFLQGEAFPILAMSLFPSNNICIKAQKTIPDGLERVVGGSFARAFNSRIYIGGNKKYLNEIYYSRMENPLYFPSDGGINIGENSTAVTAVAQKSGELYFFKTDEIYKLSVTHGKSYKVKDFTFNEGEKLFYSDTVRSTLICSSIGALSGESIKICNGALVWQGNDGNVYKMTDSNKNIINLSLPSESFISKYPKADFALFYEGYYMLFFGKDVYLLDLSSDKSSANEGNAWFYWELPEKVRVNCGVSSNGKMYLFCTESGERIIFAAELDGSCDEQLYFENNTVNSEQLDILSGFTSLYYDFASPQIKKSFDALFLTAKGNGEITVDVGCEQFLCYFNEQESKLKKDNFETLRINPNIKGENGIKFKVFSNKKFSVLSFVFKYRELGEVH
ncbi:MAG: hypothetical protein E7562_00685 [Ruminococcaceae bacterium]|nr:hypothetical protein [Oscillospiraceae bacterium]